jgi:preprotein translocase subunit SecG
MGLFIRKREKVMNAGQEQLAGRIAGRLLSAQRRSALWLNGQASKLKRSTILMVLIFLGLGFGLWCLYLVLSVLL